MLKYQFTRMTEPEEPTWNNKVPPLAAPRRRSTPGVVAARVGLVVWPARPRSSGSARWEDLGADSETARLQATYSLGGDQVAGLIENMQSQAQAQAETNLAHSPTNPQGGNPERTRAGTCLGRLGRRCFGRVIDRGSAGALARSGGGARGLGDHGQGGGCGNARYCKRP